MHTSKTAVPVVIFTVILFSISCVYAQTLAPMSGVQNTAASTHAKIQQPVLVAMKGHVKIISSGTVNASGLQGGKAIQDGTIPPPHPRDSVSYENHLKSLASGSFPVAMAPLVPETPVANMSKSSSGTSVGSSFLGFEQNYSNTPYPPDVQVAAGPGYVMETVNLEGGIWTKQGVPVIQFRLAPFFGLGNGHIVSDPRLIYDMQSGRWFAELMDHTNSTISVAVSQTGNPAGNWNLYKIAYASPCLDFPKIATSDDKLVISTNDFTAGCESFDQSEMVVLDKNQMTSHSLSVDMADLVDKNQFSVTPARSLDSTLPLYMVANEPADMGYGITIYKISGHASNVSVSRNLTASDTVQMDPPLVPQKGTDVLLATPSHGFEDAAWYGGRLWATFTDACRPSQGPANHVYSCVHVFGYNTTTAKHLDFEVTNSNYNFSYPALTVDRLGAMYLVLGYSSSTSYPGIFASGQTRYDLPGSVEPLVQVAGGSSPDTSCRYGDYFGAAPDPDQPARAWIAGEYHYLENSFYLSEPCSGATSSPAWSTYISGVSLWDGK